MIKVIKNGNVITMNLSSDVVISKKDIVIEDDTIIDIVDNYNGAYDKLIDAENKIVMPGLVNAHTHIGMSIFRASNDNLDLNSWLNDMIWPIEDNLNSEDIYYSSLYSCVEMIKSGTTTFNDMYFGCDGVFKAVDEAKMRCLIGRSLMDSDNNAEQRLKEFYELKDLCDSNDLISLSMSPHAFYTCSSEFLKKCANISSELKLPIHMHYCENLGEVETIKNTYVADPVDALNAVNFLDKKLILAHSTFVSDYALEKFKGKDVSFVHNPLSNLDLGCGIADIKKYIDAGINVCLGTDGQGSGNNLNMFYHMSLVDLLQKGLYKNPTIFSSYEVLKMATINGAKALGLDEIIGSIEVGKKADIIIINLNDTNTYPTLNVITDLVHNTNINNVDTTIINGEVLMENGNLTLDIDLKSLKEKLKSIISSKMC